MRFSIRELMVAFAVVACVLVAFAGYGSLEASAVTFVYGIVLSKNGRRTKREWMAKAGLILSFLSFFVLSVAMFGRIMFGIGPIYSESGYPYDLQRMIEVANADTSDVKAVCKYNFIDQECVWRLTLSGDQLEKVNVALGLALVDPSNVPKEFRQAFPLFWRPTTSDESTYLSTLGFPLQSRGPDGVHLFAMYDPDKQKLFVWCKDNF